MLPASYVFSAWSLRQRAERGVYAASAWLDACAVSRLPERQESADGEAASRQRSCPDPGWGAKHMPGASPANLSVTQRLILPARCRQHAKPIQPIFRRWMSELSGWRGVS